MMKAVGGIVEVKKKKRRTKTHSIQSASATVQVLALKTFGRRPDRLLAPSQSVGRAPQTAGH
jgi:hypothetical protein